MWFTLCLVHFDLTMVFYFLFLKIYGVQLNGFFS